MRWFRRVDDAEVKDLRRLVLEQHAALVAQAAVIGTQDRAIYDLHGTLKMRDDEISDLKAQLPHRNSKGVFVRGTVS